MFLGSKDIYYQDLILTPLLSFSPSASASFPEPLWSRPSTSVPVILWGAWSCPVSRRCGPGSAVLLDWPDASLEPLFQTSE